MQVFKKIWYLLFIVCKINSMELAAATFKEEISAPKVRILLGLDATMRYKNVENLKTELQLLQQQWKDFATLYADKELDLVSQLTQLQQTTTTLNSIVLQKKIHLLQKLQQVFFQMKETREKSLELLQAHIEFWEKYFAQSLHQSNILEEKSLYTFFDFQNMTAKFFLQQDYVKKLIAEKEEISVLISKEEHMLSNKEKEMARLVQIIADKKKQTDINKDDIVLLDLEKELIAKDKDFICLQLNFYQKQLEFLSSKESVAQEKVSMLQEQLQAVRHRLYIDIADVSLYE